MNANSRNFTHRSHRVVRGESGPDVEFTQEWRCQDCCRLLGKANGVQMQIRSRTLDYVVGFPVYATCPGCGSLNVKTTV